MGNQLLSTPLLLSHLTLANRIVIPAMHTNLASSQGEVTDAMVRHYARRARGGPGVVIVEVATVEYPRGRQSLTELQIEGPQCIAGLSRLASAIKSAGPAAFLQLFHAGAQAFPHLNGGHTPVSPSGVPPRTAGTVPRTLEPAEILALRERFIQAGVWAAEAGFDGVELHAAHGYLLSDFLSPLTNRRQDDYGGSREGRCRLLLEIIAGIKRRCSRLAVSVRMNGDDFLPGGIDRYEAAAIARLLEQAGADLINVSAGMYASGLTSIESNAYAEGWRLDLSATVKTAVAIPVIGGGVIHNPQQAEAALEQGWLDLVYVGRASLADYDWPKKALQPDGAPLRPCIRCNTCVAGSFAGTPLRCAVNPEVGGAPDEREASAGEGGYYWLQSGTAAGFKPDGHPGSRVLVAGSGPAGMVAAITARRRGYLVTLAEKDDRLGGQLTLAALPRHKERIVRYRDYLVSEMKAAGVQWMTGRPVDTDLIREIAPDMLVAALGSRPKDLPASVTGTSPACILTVADALTGCRQGQRCLVVGGGETGLETAQTLALQGNAVTVVEASSQLAGAMEKKNRRSLLSSLQELPVTLYTNSTLWVLDQGTAILSTPEGECRLAVDCVIPALGREPAAVPTEWMEIGIPILVLGDAATVGNIAQATRAAYLALKS